MPPRKRAVAAVKTAVPVIDETVENQMNPGVNMVDRQPEPVVVEGANGLQYDVSKPSPELIVEDPANDARRNRVRQTESVLDAKDNAVDSDKDYIVLEFMVTGLTAQGRVWKKGEVLRMEATNDARKANADVNGDVWYELSSEAQLERFGHVKFERR